MRRSWHLRSFVGMGATHTPPHWSFAPWWLHPFSPLCTRTNPSLVTVVQPLKIDDSLWKVVSKKTYGKDTPIVQTPEKLHLLCHHLSAVTSSPLLMVGQGETEPCKQADRGVTWKVDLIKYLLEGGKKGSRRATPGKTIAVSISYCVLCPGTCPMPFPCIISFYSCNYPLSRYAFSFTDEEAETRIFSLVTWLVRWQNQDYQFASLFWTSSPPVMVVGTKDDGGRVVVLLG